MNWLNCQKAAMKAKDNVAAITLTLGFSQIPLDEKSITKILSCMPTQFSEAKLIYRASMEEITVKSFHQSCDGKPHTLIVARSTTKNVFGGYSSTAWESILGGKRAISDNSFLFALYGEEQKQIAKYIICDREKSHISLHGCFGPIFGDSELAFMMKDRWGSSLPGSTYKLVDESGKAPPTPDKFELEEIEVYQFT